MPSGIRTNGIPCFAVVAGCAGVKDPPPSVTARPLIVDVSLDGPNRDGAVVPEPLRSEAIQEEVAVALADLRQPAMTGDKAIGNEPVAGSSRRNNSPGRCRTSGEIFVRGCNSQLETPAIGEGERK